VIANLIRKLHPVYRLRQYAAGRAVLRQLDGEVWLHPEGIGFPVRGRRIQHSGLSRGYERGVVEVIRQALRDGEIESFWDVGANIGFYSWLVKTLRPTVQVQAFEPDPNNVALMRATISGARLEGIALHEIALGDRIGVTQFTFDDVSGLAGCVTESDQYSLARTTYGSAREAEVTISTIDEIRSQQNRRISLMKIDVEGHEAAVIQGALKTLAADHPTVVIECLSETLPIVTELLTGVGYSIEWIEDLNHLARPSLH
jgi:FkbM family methyltransferase